MKIIFLDIDGVLNGYNNWTILGWRIVSLLHIKALKKLYRKITDPCGVHERKVKRLARIIKATNAKVVMTSSWKHSWWETPYYIMNNKQKKLTDLFNKYNINVIDITPDLLGVGRDEEILTWLSKNEKAVENFIILDDENSFLTAFYNDIRFIQTSSAPISTMIIWQRYENTGLNNKHVKQAIQILNNLKGE